MTNEQFAYEARGAGGERIRVLLNAADKDWFDIDGPAEVLVTSDDASGPDHAVGPKGWAILQPAD